MNIRNCLKYALEKIHYSLTFLNLRIVGELCSFINVREADKNKRIVLPISTEAKRNVRLSEYCIESLR